MHLGALVIGEDVATMAGGLLNAGYFSSYCARGALSRARRAGSAALALASIAAVVEALSSAGLYWWQHETLAPGEFSAGVWALLRLPLMAATLFISMIILRRLSTS